MLKQIPVYVIDGFLEAGKTSFIKTTIASDDFFKKGKTLVLSGEEGEVEYDEAFLKKYNTVVKYFDSVEEFNPLALQKIVTEENPQRIVIELNGMWELTAIEFPTIFKIYQFIYFINYETFSLYFANMRQRMLDAVKQSDVVVFINVKEEDKDTLETYSSSFKLSNNQAQFMTMDENGNLGDAFKMVLPFDVEAPIIKVEDNDYGIWYIDTFEHPDTYKEKTIEFTCMAVLSNKLPKNTFIAGRLAMTCCSNDVQLYGHLCINNAKFKVKDREFLHIIAKIKYEFSKEYNEEECVLYPISIEKTAPLENPVLDLTK